MNILLTNDDGISAEGLHAVREAVKGLGKIFLVAPLKQKSGSGHGISVGVPIKVKEFKINGDSVGYSVDGTPADCVKMAITELIKEPIDLVISGINPGANTGINVLYSGTVSAAMEAGLAGIPAIAISICAFDDVDYRYAAKLARVLAELFKENRMPKNIVLNVSVPPIPEDKIKGIKVAYQSKSRFVETFKALPNLEGDPCFVMDGEYVEYEAGDGTDDDAVKNGYVSMTPLQSDLTNFGIMNQLKTIFSQR